MEVKSIAVHKTALWLADKRHVPFAWGQHDCNTLVVELHDFLFGTRQLDLVKGQYNDLKSALRFLKTQTQADWFESQGYLKVEQAQDLDFVSDGFHAWIVFNGYQYTVAHDNYLVRETLNTSDSTIWRSKIWEQR